MSIVSLLVIVEDGIEVFFRDNFHIFFAIEMPEDIIVQLLVPREGQELMKLLHFLFVQVATFLDQLSILSLQSTHFHISSIE